MAYREEVGTVQAEDGTEVQITVQHVAIDPSLAEHLFNKGRETGDWGWKHKVWTVPDARSLMLVQRAARYYYGWDDRSERISKTDDGLIRYEACYAC